MRQLLVLGIALLAAQTATGRQVERHPDPSASLAERWDWARDACGASACVVGYEITLRLSADERIGWTGDRKTSRTTLAELLSGRPAVSAGPSTGVVDRPVAVLLRLESGEREPARVRSATFDTWIELDGAKLVWLGPADLAASLSFLESRFRTASGDEARRSVVWTVGMHQTPARVVPWLAGVARSDGSVEVRKAATYSLGEQHTSDALRALSQIVRTDPSREVRKAGLYAAAELGGPEAFRLLAETARSPGASTEIRKAAIYALSEMDTDEARSVLIDIAMEGGMQP